MLSRVKFSVSPLGVTGSPRNEEASRCLEPPAAPACYSEAICLEERKWVRAIELMAEDRAGFWENWENGEYHIEAIRGRQMGAEMDNVFGGGDGPKILFASRSAAFVA